MPHPTIDSSTEERSVFQECAQRMNFQTSSWFLGWKPFTEDCSVFISEEAKEKCRESVAGKPTFGSVFGEIGVLLLLVVAAAILFKCSIPPEGLDGGANGSDGFGGLILPENRMEEDIVL